ncbi:CubicO group peptidase (beta-lactamase class C family) [Frigoribacterium sp. PhB107]|uniref:serine hydrolase domain-containing protein n=1 Tax=Frigoribacterium sp. PhB107 TaxID=2485172 RepID=UPI000F4970E6|nr:serine hydrolase domain-containing protein [Frigoribacterium sp. PhB107]ROP76009.1 CubicO group peptidase (beta-lactamase class C family) [Frigoribacterium sp. PhB107]
MTIDALPTSTPSAEGIDAAGVAAFLDGLESTPGVEPHSVVLVRHGSVVTQGWWAPYSADRVHLLYSLSKSFTSTAVAFAVDEGLLGLDDTVLSHFPELDADVTDPRSRSMRVRDVLAMSSGHHAEALGRALEADAADLVRGFLLTPPEADPGSVFAYNQPCTYAVAAIVQRASGLSLTDYLRPRLFEPLGVGHASWQRDGSGREIGFSGLHAQTEAVALLGQLWLQRGVWQGRQLLPASYVDEATRVQVANPDEANADWSQGYGFQFWMARHGYRGDGAYGQFCVVLPEHDVVLALTGQTVDMQAVLDLAWQHLLPALEGPGDAAADDALARRTAALGLATLEDDSGAADLRAASFVPTSSSEQPSLTSVELAGEGSSWRVLLHESDDVLEAEVVLGAWTVTDALAVTAGRRGAALQVDVVFVETPHRLHLVLDGGAADVRWETTPLHAPALRQLRAPRHGETSPL